MAAAAALAMQALPAAAEAIEVFPPPAPGEFEPDFERIGFRVYALVCCGSEVLSTLAFLGRQLDIDRGTPGSLGALLQATAASDARLLAGLQLVERMCREMCPGGSVVVAVGLLDSTHAVGAAAVDVDTVQSGRGCKWAEPGRLPS